jgi:hypothetical protein
VLACDNRICAQSRSEELCFSDPIKVQGFKEEQEPQFSISATDSWRYEEGEDKY